MVYSLCASEKVNGEGDRLRYWFSVAPVCVCDTKLHRNWLKFIYLRYLTVALSKTNINMVGRSRRSILICFAESPLKGLIFFFFAFCSLPFEWDFGCGISKRRANLSPSKRQELSICFSSYCHGDLIGHSMHEIKMHHIFSELVPLMLWWGKKALWIKGSLALFHVAHLYNCKSSVCAIAFTTAYSIYR